MNHGSWDEQTDVQSSTKKSKCLTVCEMVWVDGCREAVRMYALKTGAVFFKTDKHYGWTLL